MDFKFRKLILPIFFFLILNQKKSVADRASIFSCMFRDIDNYHVETGSYLTPGMGIVTANTSICLRDRAHVSKISRLMESAASIVVKKGPANNVDVFLQFYQDYKLKENEIGIDVVKFGWFVESFSARRTHNKVALSYEQAIETLHILSLTESRFSYGVSGAFIVSVWPEISNEQVQLVINHDPQGYFLHQHAAAVVRYKHEGVTGYFISDPGNSVLMPAMVEFNDTGHWEDITSQAMVFAQDRTIKYNYFKNEEYVLSTDYSTGFNYLYKLKPICSFTRTTAQTEILLQPLRKIERRDEFGDKIASITFDIRTKKMIFYHNNINDMAYNMDNVSFAPMDYLIKFYRFEEIASGLGFYSKTLYEKLILFQKLYADFNFMFHLESLIEIVKSSHQAVGSKLNMRQGLVQSDVA